MTKPVTHTPGPWFLFNDGKCVGGPETNEGAGQGIAMCSMRARTDDEARANARLISAAPQLLEAVLLFQGQNWSLPADDNGMEIRRRALAAVQKAMAPISVTLPPVPKTELDRLRTERDEWKALATEFKGLTEEWQARAEGIPPSDHVETLQERVQPWMMACFGPEISADRLERNDRFIEEALELVQASDYPKERALALVDYVYGRDQGEINQEVGGVMITLAAHCLAHGVDMHQAGETELARIWTKVEAIRAKQAAKPTGSALPIAAATSEGSTDA